MPHYEWITIDSHTCPDCGSSTHWKVEDMGDNLRYYCQRCFRVIIPSELPPTYSIKVQLNQIDEESVSAR